MAYVGRFAPSPSGRLHLGSLVTAFAALWRSLNQKGKFLIRIEDLDFPRCPIANIPTMLEELKLLQIHSSEPILIQGLALQSYEQNICKLLDSQQAYICTCTRAKLKEQPCTCEHHLDPHFNWQTPFSVRCSLPELTHYPFFIDNNLGKITQEQLSIPVANNLVLYRSDNIIAYNLAVVIDDLRQQVTEIVRGADLLDATFLQLCLYEKLQAKAPSFLHIPLLTNEQGNKLSKQNHAPAILDQLTPAQAILQSATLLNQVQHQANTNIFRFTQAQQENHNQLLQELACQLFTIEEQFSSKLQLISSDLAKVSHSILGKVQNTLHQLNLNQPCTYRKSYEQTLQRYLKENQTNLSSLIFNSLLIINNPLEIEQLIQKTSTLYGKDLKEQTVLAKLHQEPRTLEQLKIPGLLSTMGNIIKQHSIELSQEQTSLYLALCHQLNLIISQEFNLEHLPKHNIKISC